MLISKDDQYANACISSYGARLQVRQVGAKGGVYSVGSLQMFDGGIEVCAPVDHSGGANCNPRGKMALGAVNLQARVSAAVMGWLNSLEDNPFHVTLASAGGLASA